MSDGAHPIDYWGIREAIGKAINAWPGLERLPILLEESAEVPPEALPCVMIYLTERVSPDDIQRLAAGRRTDFRITFSVWVIDYSLDSLREATKRRDTLLAQVELALMKDRKLGGAVNGLSLFGGVVQFGRDEKSAAFATGIETLVRCDVYASL